MISENNIWWNNIWRNEIFPFAVKGKSMETETSRWSEFLNGVKATAKRLGSEARNESKRAGQRVSQSGIQKGKLAT